MAALSLHPLPPLPLPRASQAYFLRLGVRCRVHWLRLLLSLATLTLGGGTLVSLLLGRPAAWLSAERPAHATALLAAYLVFFSRGGQPLYHAYRYRPLRDAWQLVASAQAALGAAGGVEAGLAAGLHLPAALLLGVLGGNGGALLAEASDLLLQGHARYAAPISGPGPGAVLAVWGALAYAALRAGPPALAGLAAGAGALLSGSSGSGGGGGGGLAAAAAAAAAALPPAVPPATARALVVLAVAWANFSIPGRPLAQRGSAYLGYLLPCGFVPVWHPGAGGAASEAEAAEQTAVPPPWPLDAGMFGYEVESLAEIQQRSEAPAAAAAAADAAAAPAGRAAAPRSARKARQ